MEQRPKNCKEEPIEEQESSQSLTFPLEISRSRSPLTILTTDLEGIRLQSPTVSTSTNFEAAFDHFINNTTNNANIVSDASSVPSLPKHLSNQRAFLSKSLDLPKPVGASRKLQYPKSPTTESISSLRRTVSDVTEVKIRKSITFDDNNEDTILRGSKRPMTHQHVDSLSTNLLTVRSDSSNIRHCKEKLPKITNSTEQLHSHRNSAKEFSTGFSLGNPSESSLLPNIAQPQPHRLAPAFSIDHNWSAFISSDKENASPNLSQQPNTTDSQKLEPEQNFQQAFSPIPSPRSSLSGSGRLKKSHTVLSLRGIALTDDESEHHTSHLRLSKSINLPMIAQTSRSAPSSPSRLQPLLLPNKRKNFPYVTCETVAKLLEGGFPSLRYVIVDCRFDYEYKGGHIRGAVNIHEKEELERQYISNPIPDKDLIFIFHCEFSSMRGPTLCQHLRSKDREVHIETYPELYYPQVYILEGGFKKFWEEYPNLCEPRGYVEMLDPNYKDEYKQYKPALHKLTSKVKRSYSTGDLSKQWNTPRKAATRSDQFGYHLNNTTSIPPAIQINGFNEDQARKQ